MEVRKVLIRTDGIKYIIIPKKSKIQPGKLVMVEEINEESVKEQLNKELKEGGY